jgi:hypothetical protein
MTVFSCPLSPQDQYIQQHQLLRSCFYDYLNTMKKRSFSFEDLMQISSKLASDTVKVQAIILRTERLEYLDLHATKKTKAVAASLLTQALDLEKPMMIHFDKPSLHNQALKQLFLSNSKELRLQLRQQQELASAIDASLDCFRLFLDHVNSIPEALHARNPSYHLPSSTAFFFFSGAIATERFKMLKKIGEGTYGKVYQVLGRGKDFAFKQYKYDRSSAQHHLSSELNPYIVLPPHPNLLKIEAIGEYGLFFELAASDLYTHFDNPTYNFPKICRDFSQIAAGLNHIHQQGFNFKDLKPSNILCFADGTVKICDLGFLQLESIDKDYHVLQCYAAPEYLPSLGQKISSKADVWSLGICLFQALTKGHYPPFSLCFDDPSYLEKVFNHLQQGPITKEFLLNTLPSRAQLCIAARDPQHRLIDVIIDCLQLDPASRPSMVKLKKTFDDYSQQ